MGDRPAVALWDHTVSLAETADGKENARIPPVSLAGFDPLGGADVVGLGEATHGSREFVRLKHRLLQHLVENRGFRTVAFEADVAAMAAVDDAVRRERGDVAGTLSNLKWSFRTEELRVVLGWLRSFNQGRPRTDRVRVRGIDPIDTATLAHRLGSSVAAVEPGYARTSDAVLTLTNCEIPADQTAREQALDRVSAAAGRVADWLEERSGGVVEDGSIPAVDELRRRCRVLEESCAFQRVRHRHDGPHPAGMEARDRYMAETVRRALAGDRGEGVAVWAHNGHVQRGTFDDGQIWTDCTTMGERLDRTIGDRYVPIGFDFGRGAFRAIPAGSGRGEPETFTVGAPNEASATAQLDAMSHSPCLVDLTRAASDSRLDGWLATHREIRQVGSVFDPDADPSTHSLQTVLPVSFDGLCFVSRSTPTRPIRDR